MPAEPGWFSRAFRRLYALRNGEALDRELDEEIRQHIELESQDLMQREGLTLDEARRRALVAFGGVERYREAQHDERGWRCLEDLVKDVKYSLRGLIRTPTFSLSVITVLALGIGASAAMFSAVDAVLLASLPYRDGDQLVRIYQQNTPTNRFGISTVDYQAVETLGGTFSAVGAASPRNMAVSAGTDPVQVSVGRVTAGFFRALEITPATGRPLMSGDGIVGAPPVVVLGHSFATRSFGSPAAALGRSVTIDGSAHTVIGILPPSVVELAGIRSQVWPVLQVAAPTRRGPFWLILVGRIAPGVSLEDTKSHLATLSQRVFPLWAASFQDSVARLTPEPLRRALQGNARPTLRIFSAAVALVLFIAIANVVNLMLVRVSGRWREVVLRTTLGATRGRMIRMILTESIVLTLAGGTLGIVIGIGGLHLLARIAPDLHGIADARFGWSGVAFAAMVAMLTGAIVAAYPVTLLLRREESTALRDGGRGASAGKRTGILRASFVVAEFALALPLLAGAGLLLNSFVRLQRVHPGFDPQHILTVAVRLPSARYSGDTAIAAYWTNALSRIREIPGVVSAGMATALPPNDENICCNNFDLLDHPVSPGEPQPVSPWAMANQTYFDALGVELLAGRFFTSADSAGAPPAIIVSRTWADHFFPGLDPLGRQLISGGCTACPHTTIVGVVGDVKYQGLGGSGEAAYDPVTGGWPIFLNLFVRTSGPPADVLAQVQAALLSVDPGVPLDDAAPMEDRLYASMADPRKMVTLVGAFAGVALLLAAIGVFGMLSYTVSTRRREIGVRMALGATPSSVIGMIVGRGMLQAGLGAILGLIVASLGTRLLSSGLFGVGARDPGTLAAVTALLMGVAGFACWLAARRTASVNPVEAIRAE
ncbi:MAG: ABC transporter permease [Gemmatimonadota bacterium]